MKMNKPILCKLKLHWWTNWMPGREGKEIRMCKRSFCITHELRDKK